MVAPIAEVTKAIGLQPRRPIKRCPAALSSTGTNLLGYCFGREGPRFHSGRPSRRPQGIRPP
jgi:hypothetical protein